MAIFPKVKTVGALEGKIAQTLKKIEVNPANDFKIQIKLWQKIVARQYDYVMFLYFLILSCFVAVYLGKHLYALPISYVRWFWLCILIVLVVAYYYMKIAKMYKNIVDLKIRCVYNYLLAEQGPGSEAGLTDKFSQLLKGDSNQYRKQWSLLFGYRLDWITVYKDYVLFPRIGHFIQRVKVDRIALKRRSDKYVNEELQFKSSFYIKFLRVLDFWMGKIK